MGRPLGSKNKPKPGTPAIYFSPDRFVDDPGAGVTWDQREPSSKMESEEFGTAGLALDIYNRVPQYERIAREFLEDEDKLEKYIQINALVLMQMERDSAVLIPTTRSEISAAIKSRYNFVQKAHELMQLIIQSRELRVREMDAKLEMLARQEGREESEG